MKRLNALIQVLSCALVAVAAAAQPAFAQEKYPSRPIEFIVPWGPGGRA